MAIMRQFKPGQLQTGSLYDITSSYALTASYALGFDSSSLLLSESFNAFTASYTTGSFTGSFRGDGSGLTNLPIPIIDTGSLVTTASFTAYTASQALVSQSFNSRINTLTSSVDTLTISYNGFTSSYTTGSFTGSFIGSLLGTAATASYITASNVVGTVTSASYAESASYLIGGTGSFVTTASFNAFTASYTTGSFTGSFRGDGSQLTGIVSSKWSGSNPISRDSNVEITGSLKVDGSISATNLTGTDNRIVVADPTGEIQSTNQTIIQTYIDPTSAVALLLDDTNNWDISGFYIGTLITGTFQGQRHYNVDYFFEAIDDNDWIRLIRG